MRDDLFLLYPDIQPFLFENEDLAPATREMLLSFLEDDEIRLRVELAETVDAGETFVKATYDLEGDTFLAVKAYDVINHLREFVRICHLSNLKRIATDIGQAQPTNPGIAGQLYTCGLTCVQPGFDYFTSKFATDRILANDLACFKAARLCHPGRVNDLRPNAIDVQEMKSFPFVTESDVDLLVAELPRYIAATDGCLVDVDALEWWRRHKNDLPKLQQNVSFHCCSALSVTDRTWPWRTMWKHH